MIRTSIIQEIRLEDRLKPTVAEKKEIRPGTYYQCCQRNFDNAMHSKLACGLLRSPSLERLRQFPSYICTRGSYDFKIWLESSRTALSDSIYRSLKLVHAILFTVLLYSIVFIIFAQIFLTINTLVYCNIPRGPTFLYVTTAVLGAIIFMALPHIGTMTSKLRPQEQTQNFNESTVTSSITEAKDKME